MQPQQAKIRLDQLGNAPQAPVRLFPLPRIVDDDPITGGQLHRTRQTQQLGRQRPSPMARNFETIGRRQRRRVVWPNNQDRECLSSCQTSWSYACAQGLRLSFVVPPAATAG